MLNTSETQELWRKHWFTVNVLNEIPIAGSFSKKTNCSKALYAAGKCIAALTGGTAAMMAMMPTHEDDLSAQLLKTTGSMVLGMTAGKVLYNGGVMLFQYCAQRNNPVTIETTDVELQALTSNPPGIKP